MPGWENQDSMCTVATEPVFELLVNFIPGITGKSVNACRESEKYPNLIF